MTGAAATRTAIFARLSSDAAFAALLNDDSDRIAYGYVPDIPELFPDGLKGPMFCYRALTPGDVYDTSAVPDPKNDSAGEMMFLCVAIAEVDSEFDSEAFAAEGDFGSLEEIVEAAWGLLNQYAGTHGDRRIKFHVRRTFSDMAPYNSKTYRAEGFQLWASFSAKL